VSNISRRSIHMQTRPLNWSLLSEYIYIWNLKGVGYSIVTLSLNRMGKEVHLNRVIKTVRNRLSFDIKAMQKAMRFKLLQETKTTRLLLLRVHTARVYHVSLV
jgi:hypothetical protein